MISDSMAVSLKKIVRKLLPESVVRILARLKAGLKICHARLIFAMNPVSGETLPISELEELCKHYEEPPKIRYDPEGLMIRARENISRMEKWIDPSKISSALEIGCWDGMACAQMKSPERRCYGLDISRRGFDPRAIKAGVGVLQADAGRFPIHGQSMDLIFSFASLEHFPDPHLTLKEAARVLRPGGRLFLEFGPIATAPYGLHAYRSIPVPYVQILFKKEDLVGYAQQKGLSSDWPYINGITLSEYRRIFEEARGDFKMIACREKSSAGVGLELVRRFPGIFRRVSKNMEDFLVSGMMVCLERRSVQ